MAISLRSSRPAQSDVAIVLCTDARFLVAATALAHQLATSGETDNIDIVVSVTEDCKVPPSLDFLNLRICHLNTEGMFSGLFIGPRHTEAVYHRLALPHAFAKDYKRLLYLDCDLFFHGGDLDALLRQDMQGHAVAAALDYPLWFNPDHHAKQLKDCGLDVAPYFNSGVMLIDVAAFEAQDILNRCLEFGRQNRDRMSQHDQQLLNCVLHGTWYELDRTWNWQQIYRDGKQTVRNPVKFTHFIGNRKPWSDSKHLIPDQFKEAVRAFVSEYYPGSPEHRILEKRKGVRDWFRLLRPRNFWRHLRIRKQTRMMLAQQ